MKKLYQIWRVYECKKPAPTGIWRLSYLEVNEAKGTWAYPLIAIISTMADRWCRDDFRSLDLARIEETCKYFNDMKDDDEHYEIREVPREEY